MSHYVMGVDLGQSIDPTAIAILEITTRQEHVEKHFADPDRYHVPTEWYVKTSWGAVIGDQDSPAYLDVVHLERLPLRMPYTDQVDYVNKILARAPLTRGTPLVIDQTGVGRAVLDLFERTGLEPVGVTITGGDGEARGDNYQDWRVSKLTLISRLQALLHAGELRVSADLPDAEVLGWELGDFRAVTTESGYTRFGARSGAHDDLVLALAIASWWACRPRQTVTIQTYYL